MGSSAQLERDLKALREIWRTRSKKLGIETAGAQIRIHLNRNLEAVRNDPQLLLRLYQPWFLAKKRRVAQNGKDRQADRGKKKEPATTRPALPKHVTEAKEKLGQQFTKAVASWTASAEGAASPAEPAAGCIDVGDFDDV